MTGASTFSGGTTISGGWLTVNGSLVSPVTVNSGGGLGGVGSLASAAVNAGGKLSPGNPSAHLGVSGNLTLQSGAVLDYELDTPATSSVISAGAPWSSTASSSPTSISRPRPTSGRATR